MILVLNTGSSSVKFGVYKEGANTPQALCRGSVVNIGSTPVFSVSGTNIDIKDEVLDPSRVSGHGESIGWVLDWVGSAFPNEPIAAVGHRVVHGGAEFSSPVVIDKDILEKLIELEKLAPLHQPYNVAGISAVMAAHPGIPQVACFDTAFHQSQPKAAGMFGLPMEYYDEGIRRYGFHGLSYEYITGKMPEVTPIYTLPGCTEHLV